MVSVIGMIGPHAVGKTTAVHRWVAKYPGLVGVVADNQWEVTAAGRTSVRGWKGNKAEKQALCREAIARPLVSVIDSARGFSCWLSEFRLTDQVIVITSPEPDGRRFIEERRASKSSSPKPLADFWTPKRLEYECTGHLLNYARKHLRPEQWTHFVVSDRERDWAPIDAHFGRLFRKLHNELVKERRDGKS